MRLFTRDRDGKPDTPLSVWFGLFFVLVALWFEAINIGPGGLGLSPTLGDVGINLFFLLVGLCSLIPGLMLTLTRSPDEG
jgi:hypothetical protein